MNQETSFQLATFAGGCFWCLVPPFKQLKGVSQVLCGYIGGDLENPSYEDICSGETGHYEAVQISFNPELISYEDLLRVFILQIDPTDPGGQFADRGSQYKTAIFYHDDSQKNQAEKFLQSLQYDKPIATQILMATKFYEAEDYHQDYHSKQPLRYQFYREGSGRSRYIDAQLKSKLSAEQYAVTQQCGTERPFDNEYWDNHEEGIYVDIVSGEPLFASSHKFDSGTGWPSFFQPINPNSIVEIEDTSHGMRRIEVRSRLSDSHLGHLFYDGPHGVRYCINSSALRFVPLKEILE